MNDMIIKAAQDPSCILAVTPDRGGSWWATLRPGGNYPWPSPVPRNFAEEPETWYAAAAASSEISTHDFYFEIEFISYQKPESNAPVFYNIRVYEPFGICLRNDGNIIATVTYTNLWEGAGRQYLSLLEGDFGYGELVKAKVVRQNGAVEIFCNDVLKKSVTMTGSSSPVQFTTMPSANFNGTIKRITIFDLTTGKTVWSYPSEAERVQLITKTNIRTDRGVFEAADTSKTATIATQLTGTPETFLVFGDDGGILEGVALPGGVFTIPAGTKIRSMIGFDRSLTAAEIAALMPKKQLLSWAGIQDVVRRGRAENYFSVGDVIEVKTPRWTIQYEVVGFDQIEPADSSLIHSMTLLPVNLITGLQFDAPEPENPDPNRSEHGCNRWDWSAIRQWLNSAAAPGEWWTAQHEYDVAPDYAATMAGFMADLPADFLSAVAPARIVTALPNADGGGSIETVDRFWLPSRTEIFGDANSGVAEGVLMTKYVDATDADRIKYKAPGNPYSWFLRSANTSQTHYVAFVKTTGIYSTSFLVEWRVAAACIIA